MSNAEVTLIGLTISDRVIGTGGPLCGRTTEAHGFELLGKIISVSYAAVEV